VLRQQGDWQEARHCLNRVLKLDPGYAEAWYNLAALAREHDDLAGARRNLEKAIAADPGYPDPLYNLALLDFGAGDHAEAARLWARYLELDPESAWSRKARQGLRLIGMMANRRAGRAAVRQVPAAGPGRLRPV
jgi:tetratricopeptide (TPR) repeat protein